MEAMKILNDLEDMGISRYRIAKDTGISEAGLANWYHGRVKITRPLLKVLEDYVSQKTKEGKS